MLPDATIALDYMHHLATRLVEGMTVHTDRMRENIELTHGALFSQRALTALVESGMTRDDAYRLVQEAAQRAWDEGTSFRELIGAAAPKLDLDAVFDYDAYLEHVPEVIALSTGSWNRQSKRELVGPLPPLRGGAVILYTCGQKKALASAAHPAAPPRPSTGRLRVRDPRPHPATDSCPDLG